MIYPVDAVIKPSAALPLLLLLHSTDKRLLLDRVLFLLTKTDGRDKLVKLVQYFCKLALAMNQAKYKPLVGTLAKQLSGTRRVLRLGKGLKVLDNTYDALNEPLGWKRSAALLSVAVGTLGDIGDDLCWASDMKIMPKWITEYEHWVDKLWFYSLCCDVPLNTSALIDAFAAFIKCDAEEDSVEYHNCRVKLLSAMISQIKGIADFFHSTRLAYNWPTSSSGQDAVCGIVSASCSLVKMWKPECLKKL
ncbi:hypothetical protein THRCLA_20101 [Thraustotheca clavata]|uniref:Uncharacterized protein n=1 Tax=Thraustotheca clavata TaxID=74557 RepID=A0A1W0ABT3_9STRA|nr:hypothetical protein THRCLA_20101 [Thraustotheca clavata]